MNSFFFFFFTFIIIIIIIILVVKRKRELPYPLEKHLAEWEFTAIFGMDFAQFDKLPGNFLFCFVLFCFVLFYFVFFVLF